MKRIIILLLAVLLLVGCSTTKTTIYRTASTQQEASKRMSFEWKSTPGSTCFSYIGYDSQHEKLAVIFRSNEDRAYVYSDFSASDWSEFKSADSLGSYYNKYIKGQYPSQKYDADDVR